MSSSSPSTAPGPPPEDALEAADAWRATAAGFGRLVLASDRLPLALSREEGLGWRSAAERGGLIPALTPLLRGRQSVWIGWPGAAGEAALRLRQVLPGAIHEGGCSLRPVMLGDEEKQGWSGGFAEEVIWPLFHGLAGDCRFEPACWQAYRRVNQKFARVIARTLGHRSASPGPSPRRAALAPEGERPDLIWVHDHLLMNVAEELRRQRLRRPQGSQGPRGPQAAAARAAFFLHIPFPGPDSFLKLPWRERLLAGLLAYRQIGFQTPRDLGNFVGCVRAIFPALAVTASGMAGDMVLVSGELRGGRCELTASAFPIGIDEREIRRRAAGPEVEVRLAELRRELAGRRLILGVDALEHSQGVVEKLAAFAELLRCRPELHDRVTLLQVVLPGRAGLEAGDRHQALRAEIERRVGEIDGRFSRPGWVPVVYRRQPSLAESEMLALYRLADVMLLTPLRDGMNLVAKEFCAAQLEGQGALVLSEFAGAAPQLAGGALLVNPYDTAGTARILLHALRLPPAERAARMETLRREVRRRDVFWWAAAFLRAWGPARGADLAPRQAPARQGL